MLSDNEIIKALQDVLALMCNDGDLQRASKIKNALDLIKRKDADIEEFKKVIDNMADSLVQKDAEIEKLTVQMHAFKLGMKIEAEKAEKAQEENLKLFQKLHQIRAEAIKEFATELYNSLRQYENYDTHHTYEILDRIVSVEEFLLNNLVKEMVGDDNA